MLQCCPGRRPLPTAAAWPRSGPQRRPAAARRVAAPGGRRRVPAVHVAALHSRQPGLISKLVIQQLSGVTGLDTRLQFLLAHVVGSGVVPVLAGWLLIGAVRALARRAREFLADPDRPLGAEVIGMLPTVLERPTVVTVTIMVALRLVRNATWVLDTYIHTFAPKWDRSVDVLVEYVCGALAPIDRALVTVYSLLLLALATVVFVRWKSVVLEFVLLRQQRLQQQQGQQGPGGKAAAARRSTEDLERLLVPLEAVTGWLAYLVSFLLAAQILGVNIAPLLAVGGVSSVVVGLASQQLLTNAIMGLSLFLSRPFVAGDSVTCQGSGLSLSGVVENVTPMRTTLRTEEGSILTIPNKTVADMVVINRSVTLARSRMARANRQTELLKLRVKVPHAAAGRLQAVQAAVLAVLAAAPQQGEGEGGGEAARLVVPGSVEVALSRLTDEGPQLVIKGQLRAEPDSPEVQAMLLELSCRVHEEGAVLLTM